MKKEDFYQQFLSATGGNPVAGIEEPDLSADVTSGTWEDLLIKWKVQIQVWLKTNDCSKSSNSTTLPFALFDSYTKAQVVEKQGKDFLLLKIQNPPSYAFLHYSRVWVDGAIPSSAAEIFKKKLALKIAARRVFLTGKAKYQVTYAHSGMSVNKFGACKYNDTMKAFMNRCQARRGLQEHLEDYMTATEVKAE